MGESKGVKWLSSYVKYTQPSWQDRPTSDALKIKLNTGAQQGASTGGVQTT